MESEFNFESIFDDIIIFSTVLLNFEPFEYQIPFLRDNHNRISFRSGRQIGKSTLTALKVLYRAIINPKEQVLVLSPSQRQSTLLFNKILDFIKEPLIFNNFIDRQTLTSIYFKNGSKIYVVPAGYQGTAVRGFSPTLIVIDEAAFLDDSVFTAIEPSLSATSGDLIMLSTPFGKRGRFYESFMSSSFSHHHIKSEANPLIKKEFLENERKHMTLVDYMQEYEGEFIDEADTFFKRELVMSCVSDIPVEFGMEMGFKYFLGVDCARFGNDETVYIIGKSDGKTMKIINITSTSKQPSTDIMGRVQDLHRVFRFEKIYMDETGLGGGAIDFLKEQNLPVTNLKGEIGGIQFTLQNKEVIYKNLKYLMENKLIQFPEHRSLILEMTNLQYEYTASGYLKIHHPNSSNAHDDYVDALALCAFGLKVQTPPLVFMNFGNIWKK